MLVSFNNLLSKADSNHHKQNQNLLCYHYTIGQFRCKAVAKVVVFCATTKFFNRFFFFVYSNRYTLMEVIHLLQCSGCSFTSPLPNNSFSFLFAQVGISRQ